MATPLEQKRIFLFKNFGKYLKVKYKGIPTSLVDINLGEEPPQGFGWKTFMDLYFKDEDTVKTFFSDIKKLYNAFKGVKQKQTIQSWVPNVDLTKDDPKNLFVEYSCDIESIKNTTFCKGTDIKNPTDYEGIYDTDQKAVPLVILEPNDDGVSLDATFPQLEDDPIYKKYAKVNLVHTTNENFDVYIDGQKIPSALVTFAGDKQSFNFNLVIYKGKAKKRADKTLPIDNKKTDTKKKDTDKTNNTNNSNSGQVKVVKNIFKFPDVNDDQPGYVSPESHTQDCKDFPFTLGCINKTIGDINEKFFGRGHRRGEVFGTELLDLLTGGGYLNPDDKDPKITEELYARIMRDFKKDVIKESVKKVLKEYINKKK
jgi:hypothetical protein